MSQTAQDKIVTLLMPVAEGMGYQWYGVDLLSDKIGGGLLRIYLDKTGGISIDDCVKAGQQFIAVLRVEEMNTQYRIEVSSPGLDRPLFTAQHWHDAIGQEVKVKLNRPILDRRQYRGIVKAVTEDEVVLSEVTEEKIIPLTSISKANIIPIIDFKRSKARQ